MQLARDGAQLFPRAFGATELAALTDPFSDAASSTRLGRLPGLKARLSPADAIANALLGPDARAVAAKYFDKSPRRNWALGWHQDRTIPVRERRDVPGFTHWTVKAGIPHCFAPSDILERTLTLRIHLDPAGSDNAPLLIAPGSHRLGPVREQDIRATVARCGTHACLAEAGDVWAYSTPILHSSARAAAPSRRRVLQILYSAETLPGGLEWLGV